MMKVIDLDEYRKARQRVPGINWTLILGIVGSIACWAAIGWIIWGATH